MKKNRVIHLPANVGGNAQILSDYLKHYGFKSEVWVAYQDSLNYKSDKILSNPSDSKYSFFLKNLIALNYLFRFDIVIFNYGQTLFSPVVSSHKESRFRLNNLQFTLVKFILKVLQKIELIVLKFRKVSIIVFYQGDDARQTDYCLNNFDISVSKYVDRTPRDEEMDKAKRKQIKLLTEYADLTFALNPDLLNVLPASSKFLPYSNVNLSQWKPVGGIKTELLLNLGHAPTNRQSKGTQFILDAVESLRKKGHAFNFTLIEDVPHSQVRDKFETIDILIDQILIGWYGGVAVEFMALGKPVMAYLRESDLRFIPTEMCQDIPIMNVTVNSLEANLVKVLNMSRAHIELLGSQSRSYVEKWHNPEIISRSLANQLINLKR